MDSAIGSPPESSQKLNDMTLADLTGVLKAALVNPPIPDFSFTGRASVSGYLAKLQDFFLMYNVPERKKFPIALATLRREALNWFELIAKKDILKEPEYFRFGKLKKMLESTFCPPQNFQLENELYTRIQKVGEPLTQFLVRKLEIFNWLGKSDSDEEKLGLIIPRLLPEIQETIEMRNIATVSELYSFSQRYDSRRSRCNDRGFQPGIQEKTLKNTNFSSKPVTDQKFGSRSSFQPENRPRGLRQPQRLSANSNPQPNLNRVSVTTAELPFIFLQIEGRTIKCLLDSGSETCLISSSCYFENFRNIRYSPSPISVTTADGTRRKVYGSVKLQLASGQEVIKWNFLILNGLESPVILGVDLLANASAILDFKKKAVSWELEKPHPLEPVDLSTLDLPLFPDQKASALSMFQNFPSLFTSEPGLTNAGAHEIKLTSENPIRARPYRYDRGKENLVADALSRTPVEEEESVKCRMLTSLVLDSKDQIIQELKSDSEFKDIYAFLENPDSYLELNRDIVERRSGHYEINDGLLYYKYKPNSVGEFRPVIPRSLRLMVLQHFHDLPTAGHGGIRKTFSRLHESVFWPQLRKYVNEYVKSCDLCQRYNYINSRSAGFLHSITAKFPNEIVGIDLLGPYPRSKNGKFRFLLVIVDHFSKWLELVPLRKASASAVAHAFVNNYILKYGAPVKVISDNGPQFLSQVWQDTLHRLEIQHAKIVPYRPQSNIAERVNRNIVRFLGIYVGQNHSAWDQYLNELAYSLRSVRHDTTRKTPAELFLGRKLITPLDALFFNPARAAEFQTQNLTDLFKQALRNIEQEQTLQAKYYNKARRETNLAIGDLVLKATHNLSSAPQNIIAKFCPKFDGPYKVIQIFNDNNMKIESLTDSSVITVNADGVRKYFPRDQMSLLQDLRVGSTVPQSPHLPAEILSPRSSLLGDQAESSVTDPPNAPTQRNPRLPSQKKTTPSVDELAPPKKPRISRAAQPSQQHGQRRPTLIPINGPAHVKRPRVTFSHEEQLSGPKLRPRSVRYSPQPSPPRRKTRRPKLSTQPVSPPTESPQASTSAYPQKHYLGPTRRRHRFVQPVNDYKKRRNKKLKTLD